MFRQFDDRTRANMEVALERACGDLSVHDYATRKAVAERLISCVEAGHTTLGDLTKAAVKAAAEARRRISES